MKRKDFLRISFYTGLGLCFPIVHSSSAKAEIPGIAQALSLNQILDKASIMAAGKAYISQVPAENTKTKLEEILLKGSAITASTPSQAVHDYFDKKTLDDFNQNNTIVVSGWILAQTEARQCALYYLTNPTQI